MCYISIYRERERICGGERRSREMLFLVSGGERVEEICLLVLSGGGTFDAEIYEMKHE